MKNCLTCALFRDCTDKRKAFSFVCNKFTKKATKAVLAVDIEQRAMRKLVKAAEEEKRNKLELHKPKGKQSTKLKKFDRDDHIEDEEEEHSIRRVMREIAKAEDMTGISPDMKFDDRDMPLARNFFEFVTNPKFLEFEPWAKQIEFGTNFFSEICWNKKCTDVKYAHNMDVKATPDDILDHVQFLEHGKCPKCKQTRADFWRKGLDHPHYELIGLAGQRSSKSAMAALYSVYMIHRLLKLQNPARVYKVMKNQTLHMTWAARTFTQAKTTLFNTIRDMMLDSEWYKSYFALLDSYAGKYSDEPLYAINSETLQFRTRNLLGVISGPDQRTMRGSTRILAVIDELGWIIAKTDDPMKLDAHQVYTVLRNSMLTTTAAARRYHEEGSYKIPGTFLAAISSPSSIGDKICSLYEESKTNTEMWGFHRSVLEINPTITEKDLEPFMSDMIAFRRDFLAIPPNATNPFISSKETVLGMVDKTKRNCIKLIPVYTKSQSGTNLKSADVKFRGDVNQYAKLLTLDAGERKNSFAGVLSHIEDDIMVVDGMFEIMPEPEHPLSFYDVYENILTPIIKKQNVKVLGTDRWNAAMLLTQAEAELDILPIQYSLKYDDFLGLKESMIACNIIIPKLEMKIKDALHNSGKDYPFCFEDTPMAHFAVQCLTVEDYLKKTVGKGNKKTDDIFRAFALNHKLIWQEDVIAQLNIGFIEVRPKALGYYGSYGNRASFSTPHSTVAVLGSYSQAGRTKGRAFTNRR